MPGHDTARPHPRRHPPAAMVTAMGEHARPALVVDQGRLLTRSVLDVPAQVSRADAVVAPQLGTRAVPDDLTGLEDVGLVGRA